MWKEAEQQLSGPHISVTFLSLSPALEFLIGSEVISLQSVKDGLGRKTCTSVSHRPLVQQHRHQDVIRKEPLRQMDYAGN